MNYCTYEQHSGSVGSPNVAECFQEQVCFLCMLMCSHYSKLDDLKIAL